MAFDWRLNKREVGISGKARLFFFYLREDVINGKGEEKKQKKTGKAEFFFFSRIQQEVRIRLEIIFKKYTGCWKNLSRG